MLVAGSLAATVNIGAINASSNNDDNKDDIDAKKVTIKNAKEVNIVINVSGGR